MSTSWNHRLLLPTEHDRINFLHRQTCSRRCPEPPRYLYRYDYITGRRGRVSWAERNVCEAHARKIAAKHGLPWPPTQQASIRHARELAVRSLTGHEARTTDEHS
jgi:hypothetical protein